MIKKGVFCLGVSFLSSVNPVWSTDSQDNEDFELLDFQRSLVYVLETQDWLIEEKPILTSPQTSLQDSIVAYYGNVPPTSLYKQDKVFFLPTTPVVHTYNPIFNFGFVEAVYSVVPNEKVKDFFGKSDISCCFIVMQRLINDTTPQLLRLHGFIHGEDAGRKNSSLSVSVEIINKDDRILFADGKTSQTNTVHCHDGVASPNNFALKGWDEGIYMDEPYWQSFGVYLPATRTATLIITGQNILDRELSEMMMSPILTYGAEAYLRSLLS